MSHKIIIDYKSENGQFSLGVEYTPPHTETPENTGREVGRILKTLKRMAGDPDDGS